MGSAANVLHNLDGQREEDDEDSSTGKMVKWRGSFVSEKEAKALCHVFGDLEDHFGHQRADPNVRFNEGLTYSGHGSTWVGDIDFTYNIDGDHCDLGYMGIDVCIDLTPKLIHKHGRPMLKDYGETWVYAYLPEMTMDKVKSYVKAGTGWDVSSAGTVFDPNRNLVAIETKMHDQPKPSFWVVPEEKASFSHIGSVQDVNSDTSQRRIHRGVGIFSVSMRWRGLQTSSLLLEWAPILYSLSSVFVHGALLIALPPLFMLQRSGEATFQCIYRPVFRSSLFVKVK